VAQNLGCERVPALGTRLPLSRLGWIKFWPQTQTRLRSQISTLFSYTHSHIHTHGARFGSCLIMLQESMIVPIGT